MTCHPQPGSVSREANYSDNEDYLVLNAARLSLRRSRLRALASAVEAVLSIFFQAILMLQSISNTGLTDDSRHLRNALIGMKPPHDAALFVWGSTFGGWGKFDSTASNFGLTTDHTGFVTGFGFGRSNFSAAVSFGIGGSDFDLKNHNDTADVDSKYLAAHVTFGGDAGLTGAVGISYAWHDIDTTRTITGVPLAQTLVSQRDANTLQIFGDLSYKLMAGSTAVAPFVRVARVNTESDAVVERGGSAALIIGRAGRTTTYLSLGAKAVLNAAGDGLQPFVSAAWNRAVGDRSTELLSRFDAWGAGFAVTGQSIPNDSAELEAGLNYTSGALIIGAAYSGTLASDRSSHGARATVRLAFFKSQQTGCPSSVKLDGVPEPLSPSGETSGPINKFL